MTESESKSVNETTTTTTTTTTTSSMAAGACVSGPTDALCRQLEGVCRAQRALATRMEAEGAGLRDVAQSTDAQEVERIVQRCALYTQRLHELRREMAALGDRTRRLRRRTDGLLEKKRKYDEQVLAKERSLVAVDLTAGPKPSN